MIAAKERADFSASSLAQYKRELEQSCVMRDMQHFRKIPALMENPRLFSQYPRMVADIMNEMFTIDGKPNQPVRKMIMGHAKKIGLINLLKDGIKGATALLFFQRLPVTAARQFIDQFQRIRCCVFNPQNCFLIKVVKNHAFDLPFC